MRLQIAEGIYYDFSYQIENYDTAEPASDKHQRFMEILQKHSLNPAEAIEEWKLLKITAKDLRSKCICSHPIERNYFVENPFTKTTLCIGSECINRWIKPKLTCEQCDCVLQNATHRVKFNKFLCKECNLQKKRELVQQEEERKLQELRASIEKQRKEEKRRLDIARKENLVLFWYGPYYQRKFKEVIQDEAYVEKLINIPQERWTPTLKAFSEYAHLIYEIADVPEVEAT
jgi:hypothetical protein